MDRNSRGRFDQRTLVVVGATLSGLAVPVTGLLDHAGGREWVLAHAALGVLCVGFCIWHAALHRRGLLPRFGISALLRHDGRHRVHLGATVCGLTLPATGLLDYVYAGEWAAAHVAVAALCTVLCTWHIVLNRARLHRYIRVRMTGLRLPSAEAVTAGAVTGGVLTASVIHALGV